MAGVARFQGKKSAYADEIERTAGAPARGEFLANSINALTKLWDRLHCFVAAASNWWIVPALLAFWFQKLLTDSLSGFPIVQYELAGSSDRADELIHQWVASGAFANEAAVEEVIRQSIAWDWALIASYVVAISVGLLFVRSQFQSPWARTVIRTMSVGAIFAGLLDVVENLAMLRYLNGGPAWLPSLTATVAWPKFTLLTFAFAFLGLGLVYWVLRRFLSPIGSFIAAILPFLRTNNAWGLLSQRLPEPDPRWPGPETPKQPGPGEKRVGICSSGGGIRSAAYNLGAYQALQDKGVWQTADVLSADTQPTPASPQTLTTEETPPALSPHVQQALAY